MRRDLAIRAADADRRFRRAAVDLAIAHVDAAAAVVAEREPGPLSDHLWIVRRDETTRCVLRLTEARRAFRAECERIERAAGART